MIKQLTIVCLVIYSCSSISLNRAYKKHNYIEEPVFFFQRTACYGTCPQYKISIYSDGLVMYDGVRFVDRIGCYSGFLNHQSYLQQ